MFSSSLNRDFDNIAIIGVVLFYNNYQTGSGSKLLSQSRFIIAIHVEIKNRSLVFRIFSIIVIVVRLVHRI